MCPTLQSPFCFGMGKDPSGLPKETLETDILIRGERSQWEIYVTQSKYIRGPCAVQALNVQVEAYTAGFLNSTRRWSPGTTCCQKFSGCLVPDQCMEEFWPEFYPFVNIPQILPITWFSTSMLLLCACTLYCVESELLHSVS